MIQPIETVDLKLVSDGWPFALANADGIAAHWAGEVDKKPALFDGKVLGALSPKVEMGVLSAQMVIVPFSAFLAWRDWGFPDKTYFNIFGSAVIAGNDGGYLFAVMGAHTSNAGQIYPCGGSLEPGDVDASGRADLWSSMARELGEETGLDASEAAIGESFLSPSGQLMSITRVFHFDQPAEALANRVMRNLDAQTDRELERIVVLREPSDIVADKMPAYAIQTAEYLLRRV